MLWMRRYRVPPEDTKSPAFYQVHELLFAAEVIHGIPLDRGILALRIEVILAAEELAPRDRLIQQMSLGVEYAAGFQHAPHARHRCFTLLPNNHEQAIRVEDEIEKTITISGERDDTADAEIGMEFLFCGLLPGPCYGFGNNIHPGRFVPFLLHVQGQIAIAAPKLQKATWIRQAVPGKDDIDPLPLLQVRRFIGPSRIA